MRSNQIKCKDQDQDQDQERRMIARKSVADQEDLPKGKRNQEEEEETLLETTSQLPNYIDILTLFTFKFQ